MEVWNPRYDIYISRLEHIQHKFIKYLCYRVKDKYSSEDYLKLCAKFHILPLVTRREIADTTYLLNIISGAIDYPGLLEKVSFDVPTKAVRHHTAFHLPLVSTNYRQNAFVWRASNCLNKQISSFDFDIFVSKAESVRRILTLDFFSKFNYL